MTTHESQAVILNGDDLIIDHIIDVARDQRPVEELKPGSVTYQRVEECAAWVARAVNDNASRTQKARGYYGINTGFGIHAAGQPFADPERTRQVSRKLIMSHSTGVGSYLDAEIVRAAMLIRANTLAKGRSGVRPVVINRLIQMLNREITPAVPSIGSLGASGDLAPLAHLALVLSKPPESMAGQEPSPGYAEISGEVLIPAQPAGRSPAGYQTRSGEEAMQWDGADQRIVLEAKEGLALNNGSTFSAALAALALHDAENLARASQVVIALSLEALQGHRDAFLPQIHEARGHPGQTAVATNVLAMAEGSQLTDPGDASHDPVHQPPQDPYSLRCVPQVLGAILETLASIRAVIEREINAATDNPLIFTRDEDALPRQYKALSGGNFHGEYLAFAMDHLSIAITELGSISERRSFWMMNPPMARGLPSMLVSGDESQIDSGLMITQYVAAALVSKCKTLAHPDSIDSIPTSANQEDHVSMSMNAGLHAREIVENITAVIAIEALSAFAAVRHRLNGYRRDDPNSAEWSVTALGRGSQAAWTALRQNAPQILDMPLDRDVVPYPYLRTMINLIKSGVLVEAVQAAGIRLHEVKADTKLV